MRSTILITVLLFHIGFSACNKPDEFFIGKWQILNVVKNDDSVALNENWIHLKRDGTFESYDGDLEKEESGKWTYQNEERKVFIDGEGETGDSQWNLSRRNDTLIFESKRDTLFLIATKVE